MKKKYLAILIGLLVVSLVSAGLLQYFGRITTTIDVDQVILLDGQTQTTFDESINGVGCGKLNGGNHWLTNKNLDTKVVVDLVSTEIAEVTTYPEYKLDATALIDCPWEPADQWQANDDDSITVYLEAPVTWNDFQEITFDYLIESGTPHTPQMNIRLVDNEGNFGGYVTWHAKWLDRLGTVETKDTITNDKVGEFDKGCFSNCGGTCTAQMTAPCIRCFNEAWGIVPCDDLSDSLKFDRFSINAGDTSYCNDGEFAWGGTYGNAEQIVYVSNFNINTGTIEGIVVSQETLDNPVIGEVGFKMGYDIICNASEDTYIIDTEVQFIGTI